MHFDDTAGIVLGVAAAAGAAWHFIVIPRFEARRELIATCSHYLQLDVPKDWPDGATLRCTACPYQEPAREWVDRYHRERQERVDALRIELCPHCGSGEL